MCLLEQPVIDDPVERHFLVHQPAAYIFIQHELHPGRGDGEIRGIAGDEEVVGLTDRIRVSFETSVVTGFDRLAFIAAGKLDAQDESL